VGTGRAGKEVKRDIDPKEEPVLLVTDSAASEMRQLLDREDVQGSAIRLTRETREDGSADISLVAVEQPRPGDVEAEAKDIDILVASELAADLDDKVLDTRPSGQGFTITPQGF
jgi:Fe-S cluster assembly iron-binding protein IscA